MPEYPKLVRDLIPEKIKRNGEVPKTRIADAAEYREKLYTKLSEEARELNAEPSLEEAADVLEVLHAICALENWSLAELDAVRADKAAKRGGFAGRIILESVDAAT